jgi:hypothetical protein
LFGGALRVGTPEGRSAPVMPQPRSIPADIEDAPRFPRRARLTAATRRPKSAPTFSMPRTRARRPPCLRHMRWPSFRSTLALVGLVVGDPLGLPLTSTCSGANRFVQPDANVATLGRLGALRTERTRISRTGELTRPPPLTCRLIVTMTPLGQVTVSSSRLTTKRSLANNPILAISFWDLHFDWIPSSSRWDWNSPVP